ncbi:hypothetical protein [uncultured Sanguibacteroides sp.]|uniref:hypothetical protein n=1 Tax=uncultured Sanguibacteroides sp. TaxID=1635151 RepID=UPI0025FD04BD|nr:hypothetical protein [uncultured Sanguibacteroides sp.]
MSENRIELEELWLATDGGRVVIEQLYPESKIGFEKKRNFRIRPESEDKSPSCSVFKHKSGKYWLLQDKGGTDTTAKNAVQLVITEYQLDFVSAIRWIAERFASELIKESSEKKNLRQPEISKAPQSSEEIQIGLRKGGKFTDVELRCLGYKITQEDCDNMGLCPLDYYITARNDKGESWIISATENYPIFFWDYKDWGKIYQPFGDVRFMYYKQKPEDFVFADRKVEKLILNARSGKYPEVDEDRGIDERIQDLVICSGGSDALNVYASGFAVCWLNSETEPLNLSTYRILSKIAKNLYILYDQDYTGLQAMYRIALRYLDIYVIALPEDLARFRTSKGKPSKDVKDFFMFYRNGEVRDPRKAFKNIVKISQPLRFWNKKFDKKGNFTGFDINNECLYGFLQANGFYCLDMPSGRRKITYIQIQDNIVRIIAEDDFVKYVNDFLIRWVKKNPDYYDINLLNAIHRSNQVKLSSLDRIKVINLDFKTYGPDFDFLFFQNTAVRVTREGFEKVALEKIGKYVLDQKIIEHNFILESPSFDVEYSDKYQNLQKKLAKCPPASPVYKELKEQIDGLPEAEKYSLTIHDRDFSMLKYFYNTGRVYWKKEEAGKPLSEDERQEQDLHFISKVAALGYLMFRYKEEGKAYMVYCMETEISQEGKHLGGTGKSLSMKTLGKVRAQYVRDGQSKAMDDVEKLFDGVQKGRTEQVYIDDVKETVDLHRFMPKVTGDFEVRSLYSDTQIIPFDEAPKLSFTSNHGIKKFDSSLRRRTWFSAFSDYYHPEDRTMGIMERSPYTEFGKNLLTDYTTDEMNKFYNFMAQCLHVYLKFRCRINPPMESIEKRTIQREITDEFIWWAEEWFTPERLNCNQDKQVAYDAYQQTMPEKFRGSLKMNTFKERLRLYCRFASNKEKEYIFNPVDLFKTETERKRDDIREYRDGKDVYCFHVRLVKRNSPHPQKNDKKEQKIDGSRIEIEEPDTPF